MNNKIKTIKNTISEVYRNEKHWEDVYTLIKQGYESNPTEIEISDLDRCVKFLEWHDMNLKNENIKYTWDDIQQVVSNAALWIIEGDTIKQDHPIALQYYKRWSGKYRMRFSKILAYHIYCKVNNIVGVDDEFEEAKEDLKNLMLADINNAGMSLILAQDEVDTFFNSIFEFIDECLLDVEENEDFELQEYDEKFTPAFGTLNFNSIEELNEWLDSHLGNPDEKIHPTS